jgi:hypothetical protein
MRNLLDRRFVLAVLVALTTKLDAFASDSPYQDFVKYVDTVKHCTTLAELKPYSLVEFQKKIDNADPESSKPQLDLMRALYGSWQKLQKRSESKSGNSATVLVDCIAPEPIVMNGKKPQIKPYVLVVSMVKEDDFWKITSTAMKTPQEAADYGIKDSSAMQKDTAWSRDARNVAIPNKLLSGTLQGVPAALSSAMFSSMADHSNLDITIADTPRWKYMHLYVSLNKPPGTAAQWYTENSGVNQVQMTGTIDGQSKTLFFDNSNGCGIKLQLLPKKGDSYPAYMVLRLPDGKHSELKGYLYAKAF